MTFANFKPLLYVLAAALPGFFVAARIAAPLYAKREVITLGLSWLFATIAAFVFNDFTVFMAVMTGFCIFACATRIASLELYVVVLLAVPLVSIQLGAFGLVNTLADFNNGRLLSIALLVPMLLSSGGFSRREIGNYAAADRFVTSMFC